MYALLCCVILGQMPYEAISEAEYEKRTANLEKIDFSRGWGTHTGGGGGGRARGVRVEQVPDKFCETDACMVSQGGIQIHIPDPPLLSLTPPFD